MGFGDAVEAIKELSHELKGDTSVSDIRERLDGVVDVLEEKAQMLVDFGSKQKRDRFSELKNIGLQTEKRLYYNGITSFEQLVELGEEELSRYPYFSIEDATEAIADAKQRVNPNEYHIYH